MNAEELDRRHRTHTDCVPPDSVAPLVGLGRQDHVHRHAQRGDWFCARWWAQRLAEQGDHQAAVEVLEPFAATGWWEAAEAVAQLLVAAGRANEAIALVRPLAEAGDRLAVCGLAELLARHGRHDRLRQTTGSRVGQ